MSYLETVIQGAGGDGNSPWAVSGTVRANVIALPLPVGVSGTVGINALPLPVGVSGTLGINALPLPVGVSGTVSIAGSISGPLGVSGTIGVNALPLPVGISGTVSLPLQVGVFGLAASSGSVSSPSGVIQTAGAYSYRNIATSGTIGIKTGAGILHAVVINTRGTGSTLQLFDSQVGAGTLIATIDTTQQVGAIPYDIRFGAGLVCLVPSASVAADITISYL